MGGPAKKWYLAENGDTIILYYGDSLMKLSDSDKLLGCVFDITLPKKGKHTCEGVNVSSSVMLCMYLVYKWFVFSLSAKMARSYYQ